MQSDQTTIKAAWQTNNKKIYIIYIKHKNYKSYIHQQEQKLINSLKFAYIRTEIQRQYLNKQRILIIFIQDKLISALKVIDQEGEQNWGNCNDLEIYTNVNYDILKKCVALPQNKITFKVQNNLPPLLFKCKMLFHINIPPQKQVKIQVPCKFQF